MYEKNRGGKKDNRGGSKRNSWRSDSRVIAGYKKHTYSDPQSKSKPVKPRCYSIALLPWLIDDILGIAR